MRWCMVMCAHICWPCWYSLPSLSTVSVSVVSSAVPSVVLGLGWLRKALPLPPSRSLLWLRLYLSWDLALLEAGVWPPSL